MFDHGRDWQAPPPHAFCFYQILQMYKHSNNKAMTTGAIAAMLSTILYSRRFFPYYVYNIIGGLDEEGRVLLPDKGGGVVPRHALFHWEWK